MATLNNQNYPAPSAKLICTSTKHWTAYGRPLLLLFIGLAFFFPFGIIIIGISIYDFFNIKSKQWILTENELIIKSGILPWKKIYFEVPIEDIYEAYYTYGFWATLLRFGHLIIRRTEGTTTEFSISYMRKPSEMVGKINAIVKALKKQKANPIIISHIPTNNPGMTDELIKLSGLLEKGLLTEEEFKEQKIKLLKAG